MFTAANGWSSDSSTATVRAEKPHAGASGVPFMNRITGFSEIALSIASRIGLLTCRSSGLRWSDLEGEGVDPVAELGAEHVVNKLVLGDAAEAGKRRAFDDRLEVVPVAADVGAGTGDRSLDAILQLIG